MLINQHSLVLIMGSLQLFLTLRKLTIEKQAVVSTKRDLLQFVVGNVNKTRGQDGNQGQPKLIMQTCTSSLPSASQICSLLKVPKRSQKTSKCGKNVSDTLGYASCATFLFLPHFDVICDLHGIYLLNGAYRYLPSLPSRNS